MKLLPLFLCFLFFISEIHSQTITGKVTDYKNGNILEYVSIGITNTPLGTITNNSGEFKLNVTGQDPKTIVRFSMIGYKALTFSIEELLDKNNDIKLKKDLILISEVTVKASNELKKAGTTDRTIKGGFCGWGGNNFGKGHEIGLKIDLGDAFVKINSLHIRVHKQAFDSCLFRLHIRNIKNTLPNQELLSENILIPITKSSGWVDIDLSKYNIILKDEIALTLEWLKVLGLDEKKLMKVNDSKQESANVLFSIKRKQGCLYIKKGVEADWLKTFTQSPSIYVVVQ